MNQLKRTPFWVMIEAIHINKLNHNEFRKCDELICKIIRAYNQRDNAFSIGGSMVKLGSSDIRLIFGLQSGKRRIDLSPGQRPVSNFIQLESETENMFPRFLKWGIGTLLTKAQRVEFASSVTFQVKTDRLRSLEHEREIMGLDVEVVDRDVADMDSKNVGGDDDFVNGVNVMKETVDVGRRGGSVDARGNNKIGKSHAGNVHDHSVGVFGAGTDVQRESISTYENYRQVDSKLEEALTAITALQLQNKNKDNMISLLEEEITTLKSRSDLQAVNIVGGFGCVLKMKDEELEKLRKENGEMQKKISLLEDQLEDRDVHVVTQAFRDAGDKGVVGGSGTGCSGYGGSFLCNVSPLRTVDDCAWKAGVPRLGVQNLLVHNIKGKVRKERKLADYEYPLLGVRDRRMGSESDNVEGEKDCVSGNAVIDVDAVEVTGKKWSGFDINNRLGVWKMMTFEEKTKIKKAAIMWADDATGVTVYFTDLKGLVRQSSVRGNVINAYTELLKTKQLKLFGNDDQAEKSYFFSSVCLDMVRSADVGGLDKFVRRNISASSMCRFIHFPMCHNGHWTLVVYDTKSGKWKHYNPIRQRLERVDVHYMEALLLKEWVTNVMKQSLIELGMDVVSIEAGFNHVLEAVSRCPQQKAESLDCGIIVCAIMR
ncbi:hypothetical protein LOK49_LG02G01088 [Camellia lanceoleosa]|uniref:Uncharacterized protein n=1 Tax=Camellia lanceoleosa TaxID=1840588 RepID=A0ACC0IRX4_9ERIC|nr:hypothetical protein LOK49_LG02G01088 [Camellia lanceoleosa]